MPRVILAQDSWDGGGERRRRSGGGDQPFIEGWVAIRGAEARGVAIATQRSLEDAGLAPPRSRAEEERSLEKAIAKSISDVSSSSSSSSFSSTSSSSSS
jgi:hypothetical protein